MPVDEHERAHLGELMLDGVDEHQREAGERRDRAGDVGDDDQLRLRRPRVLELRLGRHTAVRQRVANGVAEVERTLASVPPLARQAGCELAGQRVQRLAQQLHLVATRVHELDVLGQRLAQRLRHRLGTAVGDEAAADLRLDLAFELVDAILELLALEPFLERRESAVRCVPRRLHQLLEQRVEVEVAQRPVQVVGAADRAARLHPGEALHRLAGHRPHHRLVTAEQRLHQQLGDLLGGEGVEPTASGAAAVASTGLVLHVAPQLVELGPVGVEQAVLRTAQAEVHLEYRLERPPVAVVLDERGAEGVLERLPVVDGDVLDRLHRVEVLGEADRQAGVAQLDDEPVEQPDHVRARGRRGGVGHGHTVCRAGASISQSARRRRPHPSTSQAAAATPTCCRRDR